jgi:hypothetical protein
MSLYERLGGVYAIATVVDDFIDRLMDDARLNANPKVNEAHHKVARAGLKYLVSEQVCEATGGRQRYTGRSMYDSHADLEDHRTGMAGVPRRLQADARQVRRAGNGTSRTFRHRGQHQERHRAIEKVGAPSDSFVARTIATAKHRLNKRSFSAQFEKTFGIPGLITSASYG